MKQIFEFLTELKANNNREWFTENKPFYQRAKKEFEVIVNEMITKISSFDNRLGILEPKDCIFRIYRDVRFSKIKLPYKEHFGAYLAAGGRKSQYAGYYLHIEPGASILAGGVYCPHADVLKEIRYEIYERATELKQILSDENYTKYFDGIWGSKLKTAPRGFPKDFEDIELIRYKDFNAVHHIDNEFLLDEKFIDNSAKVFAAMLPFNEYFNKIIEQAL